MKNSIVNLLYVSIILLSATASAYRQDLKPLPRGLTASERFIAIADGAEGQAPVGPIHALGEWEQADSAMTLWSNPSLVKALADNGRVTILTDHEQGRQSWLQWLRQNTINERNVDFFLVPTDSLWVRDYGPWFILDGQHRMGIIDNTYNRPRPLDDKVPDYIGEKLNLPVYQTGLIHTGGNFYTDGLGNAFSSTLVQTENPLLNAISIVRRMESFLGIQRYVTARLAPKITIEHIDTFGKLVAPDTWVVGQFPSNAPYYRDSEEFAQKLTTLMSPYGTRYKIYRMPLPPSLTNNFRAYVNSFIHNSTLFFASYGDQHDEIARQIYQRALPGYKIVAVDALGTSWGDSVHCRTKNLRTEKTIFIFPTIFRNGSSWIVRAKVIPSPGSTLASKPVIHFVGLDGSKRSFNMQEETPHIYTFSLNDYAGETLSFYIEAKDTAGLSKRAPIRAPQMLITYKATN